MTAYSPYCEISNCVQMSKTTIAVKYFALGGRESLETAINKLCHVAGIIINFYYNILLILFQTYSFACQC